MSLRVSQIKAKSILRELEFHLPPALCAPVLKSLLPQSNPYYPDNDELNLIFIHIPKTAGMSFWQAVFGIKKGHRGHIPVNRYKAYNKEKFDKYYKVAIVRNPWDRTHSAYKYLHKKKDQPDDDGIWAKKYIGDKSFPEFVMALKDASFRQNVLRWKHFIPQYKWITLPNDRNAIACNQILRFENLSTDIKKVQKKIGMRIQMPTKNKSNKRSYKDVYDVPMKHIIQKIYRRDIHMFNYSFEL